MNIYKTERFIRELVLFTCAISIFPFMTIRVLIWKWHFWIRRNENLINKNHKDYQNI